MANLHGLPGEWARVRGTVLGLWPLFLSVFVCGAATVYAVCANPAVGVPLVIVALAAGWGAAVHGLRHVERFFKGARGEEKVSGVLAALPDDYHVFNDFLAEGHHVDHVVVGPAGVFALETKYWSGKVTVEESEILVDGVLPSRHPLAQARTESLLVKRQLERLGWKGTVTPLLVFASDTFVFRVSEVQGVVVMNSNELHNCFRTQREVLDPAALERLVRLLASRT